MSTDLNLIWIAMEGAIELERVRNGKPLLIEEEETKSLAGRWRAMVRRHNRAFRKGVTEHVARGLGRR